MKPLVFVVNEHDNDTVIVDKHRLEQMLKIVYEEGRKDGCKTIQYAPLEYSWPLPDKPIEFTCENQQGNDTDIGEN